MAVMNFFAHRIIGISAEPAIIDGVAFCAVRAPVH